MTCIASRTTALVLVLALLGAGLGLGCESKRETGALVGGASGAAVGGQFGGGPEDRVLGAGIGLVLGALAGYAIGDYMEAQDRRQVSRTLENTPSGRTTAWTNPDTGTRWNATPQPAYREDKTIYRDVRLKADTDGDGRFDETVDAKAKRTKDGWEIVETD